MAIFSTNRFKSLSAEYVEESVKAAAPDVVEAEDIKESTAPDVSEVEDINEAAYIDSLLESLDD